MGGADMNSVEPCMDMDADSDMQTRSCQCGDDANSGDVVSKDVVELPDQPPRQTDDKRK